ncbi:MAG: DUF2851 family protein [Bacteroidales bacterium]|nr:DUF2851 family protein [Bacteroidales bacterium]
MSEDFLHFIWQHHLFDKTSYTLPSGESLEILSPGIRNYDEGPDFYNTRIKIENTIWVGNCEIHLNSSDWYNHQHHINPFFDNVILHVVLNNDKAAVNSKGLIIPTIEISFNKELLETYLKYSESKSDIKCSEHLGKIDPIIITSLLSKMIAERLIQRSEAIRQMLETNHYDWETCAIIWLGKAFGFKTNDTPFEMLLRSIPLSVIQRTAQNLHSLEALLLGQAGFLHHNFKEDYPQKLFSEYRFLSHKYKLNPINNHLWRKMRIRPSNFPEIRIAQLAAFLNKYPSFFRQLLETESKEQIYRFFDITASTYWDNHYQLDKPGRPFAKKLSTETIKLLTINILVPLMFAYGHEKNIDRYKEQAIRILEEMSSEQNGIIRKWEHLGLSSRNASESQALIQLYNMHCLKQQCLKCDIMYQIMTKKIYAV